jgi:hypothetical protein
MSLAVFAQTNGFGSWFLLLIHVRTSFSARPRSGGRRGGRLRPVGGRCPADPAAGAGPARRRPPGRAVGPRPRRGPCAERCGSFSLAPGELSPGSGRVRGRPGPRWRTEISSSSGSCCRLSWPGRHSARRPWAGAAIGGRVGLADHPDAGSGVGRCAPSTRGSSSGRPPCSPSGGEAVEGWSGTPSQARIWSRQRSSR